MSTIPSGGSASASPGAADTAKLHQLEVSIGAARLAADYTVQLPNLLRKWRKRMSAQSTILESVCQAEAALHALGSLAWDWAPIVGRINSTADPRPTAPPTNITPMSNVTGKSRPESLPDSVKRSLAEAAAAVKSAYTLLLQNHRLDPPRDPPATAHPSVADLPSPPRSLEAVRSLLSTSQLYLELITIKAQILHTRGAHKECLAVLTDELDLPPNKPGLQVNSMGIVYLVKAIALMVSSLSYQLAESDDSSSALDINVEAQQKLAECLRFVLFMFSSCTDQSFNDTPLPISPALPFSLPIPTDVFKSIHTREPLAYLLFLGSTTWIQSWFAMLAASSQSSQPPPAAAFRLQGPSQIGSGASPIPRGLTPSPMFAGQTRSSTPDLHDGLHSGALPQNQPIAPNVLSSGSSVQSFPSLPQGDASQPPPIPNEFLSGLPSDILSALPFPALSYQTLDFTRAFFIYAQSSNPFFTLFLAQWTIRFLVVWSEVVVHYGATAKAGPLPDTMYVEYVPLIEPLGGETVWKADNIFAELESLFRAWFAAAIKINPFPPANVPGWPPSRVNKCIEDLAATLQWTDGLLGVKSFSVQMLESTLRHTFHSMQCHRILATTHFRLGSLAQGLALLRRYIELSASAQQRAVDVFQPWIFPNLHSTMVDLFEQVGCTKDSMFATRDDGIDEFASLFVEGSQRLAENDELSEALDIARRAHHLIARFPTISQATTHAILVNLATLLGISALSSFDSSRRASQQIEAQHLLQEALGMNSGSATAHYQLGLIFADRGELSAAKMHAKQALKVNKAHVAAWHLLVLVLTATRDLDGAIKMAELGIRESVTSLVPTAPQLVPVIDTKMSGGIAKSSTFDALAALARDQTLNNTWAPAEYDQIIAAVFDLRLAQIRVVEQTRGAEAAVAMVQELFRWYKLVFDQDVLNPGAATTAIMAAAMTRRPVSSSISGGTGNQTGAPTAEDSRGRSESVRSTASTWSLSATPGAGAISLRVKQRNRKRTMLTAALANATVFEAGNNVEVGGSGNTSGSSSPNRRASVGENRPRGQSAASVTSLAVSETGSNGPDSNIATGPSISRTETLVKLWLSLSHILLNNGQLNEAASLLREAYDLPIRDPWLEGELAALDYALGNSEPALNRWHRLLARNPHHIGALIGIARAQVDVGHLEDAELLLDDLTQHAGQMSVDAWYLYGRICKAQQQPERALACFKRALELERSEPVQDFARAPRLSLVTML